ncbi:Isopentenyl-diphosphate Delta-isomerase [Granulosicoccus antarcticus IMCC3135]|uniref:isopentenyl-diphosphate Delta-isomerase n=2 Tax=Granulosicoccus TaxID=437504 RepID=A0A2Z2NXW8_9GAMM|nr:Isopentenyl-diphosphate Delta-isomerase [Granulosicoccus antarcticus IMCC3135]
MLNPHVIDNNLNDLITAINVDDDSAAYPVKKLDAHLNNIRHAAISIFVFNGSRMLLQKRAETKYHSGGLWANTVCSHPRWMESFSACAGRRQEEELGWQVPVRKFGEISYQARVGELFENEFVHCFYGQFDESIDVEQYNRDEVCEVKWLTIPEAILQIEQYPENYTQWFKIYMTKHRQMIDALLYGDMN